MAAAAARPLGPEDAWREAVEELRSIADLTRRMDRMPVVIDPLDQQLERAMTALDRYSMTLERDEREALIDVIDTFVSAVGALLRFERDVSTKGLTPSQTGALEQSRSKLWEKLRGSLRKLRRLIEDAGPGIL